MQITFNTTIFSGDPIEFGALTLSGAGGAPILEADGTYGEFTVSSGEITPNTSPLTAGSVTVGTTAVIVEADTYSFNPNDTAAGELADILAEDVSTLSGKTIKGRPGNQLWVNSTLNNRAFTSEVTITSVDPSNRLTFVGDDTRELRDPTHLKFEKVNFDWLIGESFVGTVSAARAAIVVKGNVDNFTIEDCILDGKFAEAVAAYGPSFAGEEYGWRGIFGTDGGTVCIGDYKVIDSVVRNTARGLQLPGTTGSGRVSVVGNTFEKCVTDGMLLADPFQNGCSVHWNNFKDPQNIVPREVEVLSVDTVNNRMTVDSDEFGEVDDPVPINLSESTVTMPGGVNLPGVGGSNDYGCTVVSVSDGQTILQFPVDITSAGTDVFLRQEPGHADFMQAVINSSTASSPLSDAIGLDVFGNILLGEKGPDGEYSQGIFFEDIAQSGEDAFYLDAVIAANLVLSGVIHGVSLYNPKRAILAYNTTVAVPDDDIVSFPQVAIRQQWSAVGENNLVYKNAGAGASSYIANDITSANVTVVPDDYATEGVFAGSDFTPETLAEFRQVFSRTDLDGDIDYVARTYDLPAINTVSALSFVDQTGVATSTQITSAAVQVASITNSEGNASSYGALVSVQGDGSPEFRVTSDAGGSTVVTDWTSTPAIMTAGNYVWVRHTSSGTSATQSDVFVRVGRSYDTWSTTTA